MTKKDFFDLLVKFENGKCSKSEKDLLFTFYESFQEADIMASWDLSEKELVKIQLLNRINKTINTQNPSWDKKVSKKILFRIAAIFIGLITVGYFYLQISTSGASYSIPENAITLELEDGSMEIIEENGDAKVLDKEGNVVGRQNGNELVYQEKESQSRKELVYNTLSIPYGKTFQLHLSDGTSAYLNAGSSIKYPVQFIEGMERKVFVRGEAFLDVVKDTQHPFIVQAEDLNVRVLGTQFNVSAYPEDETTEIVLVEGAVGLYTEHQEYRPDSSEHLMPGYKASFDRSKKEISKNQVITDIYTSWMEGELVFRNMSFDNILKKLERHYDVKIINENKDISDEKFNASFGSKPDIEEVLDELKITYGLTYTIEGELIHILNNQIILPMK